MYLTKDNRPVAPAVGFTLVELMVGMSISLVVIAGILSAYTFVGRHLVRLGNQQQIEAISRRAFNLLADDVGKATSVDLASSTQLAFTLLPPNANTIRTVKYSCASTGVGPLTRVVVDKVTVAGVTTPTTTTTTLFDSSTTLDFNYFNLAGKTTSTLLGIKRIELALTSKTGSSASRTLMSYSAVSPRLVLRNKPMLGSTNS